MFGWPLTFLVSALLAALFGFSNIAPAAAEIARGFFAGFLLLFLMSSAFNIFRGNSNSGSSWR